MSSASSWTPYVAGIAAALSVQGIATAATRGENRTRPEDRGGILADLTPFLRAAATGAAAAAAVNALGQVLGGGASDKGSGSAESQWPTMGFVGCGTISTAMVTGLCTAPREQDRPRKIILSPRNAAKAAALAKKFPAIVEVAASNQEVVEKSSIVFLAVLPQIARDVIPTLKFREDHTVISVIASVEVDEVVELVKPARAENVCRTVPLPAVGMRKGVTPLSANATAERIFDLLGGSVVAKSPDELARLTPITCCMGPFYRVCGVMSNWLVDHEVSEETAAKFVSGFYATVQAEVAHRVHIKPNSETFEDLVSEQTPGGLNEANVRDMGAQGVFKGYKDALAMTLRRLRGEVALTKIPDTSA